MCLASKMLKRDAKKFIQKGMWGMGGDRARCPERFEYLLPIGIGFGLCQSSDKYSDIRLENVSGLSTNYRTAGNNLLS